MYSRVDCGKPSDYFTLLAHLFMYPIYNILYIKGWFSFKKKYCILLNNNKKTINFIVFELMYVIVLRY